MKSALALFFSMALASPLRAETICSFERLCEKISGDTGSIQSLGIHPTNPTDDPQSLKAASQRLTRIFESARKSVLQLLNERANSGNLSETASLIKRVEAVQLLNHEVEFSKKFSLIRKHCELPTASFIPFGYKIVFCPQTLALPEAALFTLAAHELTHTMDPCSIQHPVIQETAQSSRLLNTRDGVRFNPKWDAALFPSMDAARFPFLKTLQCLSSPQSAAAFVPTTQDIFKKTDHGYTETFTSHALTIESLLELNKSTYEKRLGVIQKYHSRYKYCADFSGFSFANEAFADWVASQAINLRLKEMETQNLEFAQLQNFALSALSPLLQRCPQFSQEHNDPFHLSEKIRVEKIFIAQPRMAKYLGCESSAQVRVCE